MLSILEQIEPEREIAEQPKLTQVEAAVPAPSNESAPEPASPSSLTREQSSTMWLAQPSANSPELQRFSEQFARSFLENVNLVMKDAHALLTQDRKRMETTLEELKRSLRDAERVRAEVDNLRQRVDLIEAGRQQIAGRLGEAEDHLSVSLSALGNFQQTHQQLEQRLELHAGVLRTLHDAVQSREDRLNRLFSIFHALHSPGNEPSVPETMPQGV